jgi:Na+-driven multidrug efflux pump
MHLDLLGASIATLFSRAAMAVAGIWWASLRYEMLWKINARALWPDAKAVSRVAIPVLLTNLATPVGAAYLTRTVASFGPDASAGLAAIDRIWPFAFSLIYAVSGIVGPVAAPNLGAKRFERVRATLVESLRIVAISVACTWAVLFLARDLLVELLGVSGQAAAMVLLFCTWLPPAYFFLGSLFVANAVFNNLGVPLLSSAFGWARATVCTMPLIALGATYGPREALAGQALGTVVCASLAVIVAFRVVTNCSRGGPPYSRPVR